MGEMDTGGISNEVGAALPPAAVPVPAVPLPVVSAHELLAWVRPVTAVVALDGTILQISGGFLDQLQVGPEDIVGSYAPDLLTETSRPAAVKLFSQDLANADEYFASFPVEVQGRDGRRHTMDCAPQRCVFGGERYWVIVLIAHSLHSAVTVAHSLSVAGRAAIEIATGSLSHLLVGNDQGATEVVAVLHAPDGGVFTKAELVGGHTAHTEARHALASALSHCVASPHAVWNTVRHGGLVEYPMSAMPFELKAAAAQHGLHSVGIGLVRVKAKSVMAVLLLTATDSIRTGTTHIVAERLLPIFHTSASREVGEAELRRSVEIDPLTGLVNRVGLYRELERTSPEDVLMFIDLDQFKHVNDTYGHTVGDYVLTEVAYRIQEICRSEDTASRLGGDEYAVLICNVDDHTAEIIAKRIVNNVAKPLNIENGPETVTVTVGVARSCGDGAETVDRADQAMLSGKRLGRYRYVFAKGDGEPDTLI